LKFFQKRQIWVSKPHFEEVRGDAQSWLMVRWKAVVDILFTLTNFFFAIYYGSGAMRWNVYSSAIVTGGRPLYTQILLGQGGLPPTILGIRELETLGYPKVKTAPLCVPSFWHNTCVWGTDGSMDGFAIASLRHAVNNHAVHNTNETYG